MPSGNYINIYSIYARNMPTIEGSMPGGTTCLFSDYISEQKFKEKGVFLGACHETWGTWIGCLFHSNSQLGYLFATLCQCIGYLFQPWSVKRVIFLSWSVERVSFSLKIIVRVFFLQPFVSG